MTPIRTTTALLSCLFGLAAGLSLPTDAIAQQGGRRLAPSEPARAERAREEAELVRERLQTMRLAVKAFVEAEKKDAAELVERAMHARELALKGERTEEARRIIAGAPDQRQLARLMSAASELYEKWGMPDRAEALVRLAEVFGQQWQRQQAATQRGQERPEAKGRQGQNGRQEQQGGPQRLESLETRVRILEVARRAYDAAGWERNEATLAKVVRYGKAAVAGDEAAMAETVDAVPGTGALIELLRGADDLLAKAGQEDRAMACRRLAEYYAARERGDAAPERAAPRALNLAERADRIEILRLVKAAHAESGDRENVERTERVLHLAELQLVGAEPARIAEAAAGLSQERIIELVAKAADLYAKWGNRERAVACQRLVAFYRGLEPGGAGGAQARDRAPAEPPVAADREVVLRELRERVERLQRELREIQEILRRLSR